MIIYAVGIVVLLAMMGLWSIGEGDTDRRVEAWADDTAPPAPGRGRHRAPVRADRDWVIA